MSVSRFDSQLPQGLHYVEARDTRSDAEIIEELSTHRPVTSERNIWASWHSGVKSMPAWCQRNVINWVRIHGPEWTIRVLDNVPDSPNNARKYVDANLLPEAWRNGTMDGPFVGQHSADFIRTASLLTHGGVWLDVGILLFRRLEDVCWKQLKDPESPFEISAPHTTGTGMANYFVAARRGSAFIKHWHELFLHFWEGKTNCSGLAANPLMMPVLMAMASSSRSEESKKKFGFEFKVEQHVVLEYVAQIMAWQRLCMTENCGDGFNGTEYYKNKILFFDSIDESWRTEKIIGWDGKAQFETLCTRLDADPQSDAYKAADNLVWTLLKETSMQKVYHGKTLVKNETLGTIWDKPEHEGMDQAVGTFAELLRHGSVHYEQTREIDYIKAPEPETLTKKGLYEP